MITSRNSEYASSYGRHRARCYEAVEAFAEARERQAALEIGDSDARFAAAKSLFDGGCDELRSLEKAIGKTAKIDPSLAAVHNETRATLMESSFGYAVVFGTRFRQQLSPLSELLLATHQLDWRLGERCLATSRISQELQDACRDAGEHYRSLGGASLKDTKTARWKLATAQRDVTEKRQKYRAAHASSREDLWFAENELRVASRTCSQLQSSFGAQVTEFSNVLKNLELWRNAAVETLVDALATATTNFRDDLCRVGERLVAVARASPCLNQSSDDDAIGLKLKEARAKLPTFEESRAEFQARQETLDATAKSKGALVFPSLDVDKFTEEARHKAQVDRPPREPHLKVSSSEESSSRVNVEAACGAIPTMPASQLVAKKGPLEYERSFVAGSFGFAPVFLVLTFDGFLSAYPGRTEGAVEHETPAFRCDLALATVLDDDEEGPTLTITTKPKSNFTAFVVGDRHFKLRCKDAADKFAWSQALNDPLQAFHAFLCDESSCAGTTTTADAASASASSSSEQQRGRNNNPFDDDDDDDEVDATTTTSEGGSRSTGSPPAVVVPQQPPPPPPPKSSGGSTTFV